MNEAICERLVSNEIFFGFYVEAQESFARDNRSFPTDVISGNQQDLMPLKTHSEGRRHLGPRIFGPDYHLAMAFTMVVEMGITLFTRSYRSATAGLQRLFTPSTCATQISATR